jgi:hypothetical protein
VAFDKLKAALRQMDRTLKSAHVVRVGFLSGSTYPDGTSTPMVAAVQNYGAPAVGVPPRPFFSNMVAEKKAGWPAAIEAALKATDYDAQKTLELVGEEVKGQLVQAIRDFSGVPLKPRTIKRKGSDKQLIDTAQMIDSVDYEVKS